jgi:hypothetical protein
MALGCTQSLIKMSTANLAGGLKGPAREADNLNAICVPTLGLESEGASTSHNPMGLHGLLRG